VLGQATTTALTILLNAAGGRILGPADFGILYLINTVATFAYVFVDWGHGPYIIREVARHPGRTGELLGTVMVVRVVTAAMLILPSVAIGWLLGYEARTLLYIVAVMLVWVPVYLGLNYGWAFRGAERMEYDAAINVALKLQALVFGVAALASGFGLPGLLVATGISGAGTVFLASRLYHHLHFPKLHVSWAAAKEMMIGGAPMVSMTIGIAIQPYIDVNLLSRLTPTGVLGWYGAAMTFCNSLMAPAAIITSASYPRLSIVASDREHFAQILQEGFRPLLLVAVLGAVGTFLFAPVAVGIVYSLEKFGPSVSILRMFSLPMMLIFIDMMLTTALVAAGRTGNVAAAKAASVVIISSLELWMIPFFQARYGNGGLGPLAALAVGEVFMIATNVYLLRGLVTIGLAWDALRAMAAGAATLAIMRTVGPHGLAGVPICVALFGVAAYAVGMITTNDVKRLIDMVMSRIAGQRSLS
jgi:O-antigen/teichoic acid export membrane protein